eukprot:TRINITY_DN15619_c0_g1_i1.p1 TRINITY_DN15619_c0_g1~~TRINITY_DN15619_c0_g1_i1.p1  ORF type:complete len:413 (+),score=64.29 TRINITY_DN15619_c0_g1_i1:89-1240(+)
MATSPSETGGASLALLGIGLMVISRFVFTSMIICVKLWRVWEWPAFCMTGYSFLGAALSFGVVLAWTQPDLPERRAVKWVLLRGFSGAANFMLQSLAVEFGAPLGDIATLTSINMVLAALLGFVALGEKPHPLHVGALLCSIAGATLIAKPEFLFGRREAASAYMWIGYLMALGAGFFQACLFVASRKSAKVRVQWHGVSAMSQTGVVFLIYPFMVNQLSDSILVTSKFTTEMAAWIAPMCLGAMLATTLQSRAAKLSPAAISAVINTSSSMSSGYFAQVMFFDTPPDLPTVCGAVLMLIGVCIVIMLRVHEARGAKRQPQAPTLPVQETDETPAADDDETQSLSSYIASEFSGISPSSKLTGARQRRGSSTAEAQVVGALAM